jgi:uncharacterized protein with von Willebrand factor type A (vWA) domain
MEDRIVLFVRALRARGVRVSLAETADAFSAIDRMGVLEKDGFRLGLRATLIKDAADLPIFDELFPLFFGRLGAPAMQGLPEDLTEEEAEQLAEALRNFNHRIREMLEKLLNGRELSQEELDQLGKMVGLDYADDTRYQDWMRRRMEQALQFPQVREAIDDLMAILQEMGMSRERMEQMREAMQANMQSMQEQLRRFAGSRIAENLAERPSEPSAESLFDRPFTSLSDSEMDMLRKEVGRLAAVLRTRVSLRQKRARTGQLDAKATLRANLRHGGVPFDAPPQQKRKPKLVGSAMSALDAAHVWLMLSLIYPAGPGEPHACLAFIDIWSIFRRISSIGRLRRPSRRSCKGFHPAIIRPTSGAAWRISPMISSKRLTIKPP